MIYLDCLFHSSWAFAKAHLRGILEELQGKTVVIRFKVCAAHLLCLGRARFTMLSLSVTSLRNSCIQKH